ncbi:MAG: T9SS type A sorting domain-containing protein [Candidatus Latescibacterota bacterium]|nr:MAG: T9SS type A sorting domain-containing protein [Candidatus Latescibacterota bacterium]
MTRYACGLVFVAAVSLLVSSVVASPPTVTVYFDEALTMQSVDRLSPGEHTLYIVAEGFDERLRSIEYKIDYPAGMTWVADVDVPQVKIGTTGEGITQAWGEPIDGNSRVVVAKVVVRWDRQGGSNFEVAVKPHPEFGYVRAVVGPDYRIVEAEGQTSFGSVIGRTALGGSEPTLYEASPNPFNPVTQITYWVPKRAHVRLTVYDVSGRVVATLADEVRKSGEHTVDWLADDLPSGVYFCRLEVEDFSANRKLILLK